MADISMYGRNPLRSVADYQMDYQKVDDNNQKLQTNALAMQEKQRANAESNALREAMRNGLDLRSPQGQTQALQIAPNAAGPVIKSLTEAANTGAQTESRIAQGKLYGQQTVNAGLDQRVKSIGMTAQAVGMAKTPSDAIQAILQGHKDGAFGGNEGAATNLMKQAMEAFQTEAGRQKFLEELNQSVVDAPTKFRESQANQRNAATVAGTAANTAATNATRIKVAGINQAGADRRAADRPAGGGKSEPMLAVLNEDGQAEYIPRSEAAGRTPASMGSGMSPKDQQKREAAFPVSTQKVNTFESTSDVLAKDLQALRDHPGLSSVTGIAAGRLPGVTADGRAAIALYDKIVARGGFQELTDLRASSPTGGALGSVSNQEGSQLKASFAALDRKQEAKDFRAAINDAIAKVATAKKNVRDAYELTYEYRKKQPSAAGSNAAPAGVDAEDWKHMTPQERALWKK